MNTYFQFKQFIIHQDQCSMKVSEIACIQGAWTEVPLTAKKVLDMGCGTGLLSLMLAQRYPQIQIDAIEIDQEAFLQATENFKESIYHNSIHAIQTDIRTFKSSYKFDFIITNPPFFENQLEATQHKKNIAWHSQQLKLNELLAAINLHLIQDGQFSILFPYDRKNELEINARKLKFYPSKYLFIRHSEKHPIKYLVGIFSRQHTATKTEILHIKSNQTYSLHMKELMHDYYLNM